MKPICDCKTRVGVQNLPVRSLSRSARWLVRVALTVGIVAYILAKVGGRDLAHALAGVRPGALGVALAIYLIGQVLSAYKWSLIGRAVGLGRGVVPYERFYFIGMFFNLFAPSTIGGDVARALYLGAPDRRTLAANSVVFDRASGLAVLMALGAVALLVFPGYGLPWVLEAGTVAAGFALLLGWWMCPRLVRLLPADNRLRRHVEDDLGPFWRDRRLLARVAAVSLVFHLSQVLVQWQLARAAGVDVPLSYCLVYHPLISVVTAVPLTVSGFGVREGGYVFFLRHIHVDDSVAVTIGLLWFVLTLVGGLLGGAIFVASGARLPLATRDPTTPLAGHDARVA